MFVIEKLTGRPPANIIPVQKSPWAVVEMEKKKDRNDLLKQKVSKFLWTGVKANNNLKVVYDQGKKVLIVFREPAFRPTEDRVFEIKDVNYKQDLVDLEADLIASGSRIVSQKPATNDWSSTKIGRIIWKTKAPNKTWKIPTSAISKQGTKMLIRPSPVCSICHSDDHAPADCEWKNLYQGIGEKDRKPRRP